MIKVLFLDMDGVVLSGEELARTGNNRHVPEDKIALVREVCNSTGAVVVVSSTWRFSEETRDLLLHHGIPLHKDWRTPIPQLEGGLYIGGQRGHEIQHWLDAHPETSNYAIVDDDSDMLPSQAPHFVKTPFQTGLAAHHAISLKAILA